MKIEFYKYQGTGNDFIILDNRKKDYSLLNTSAIHSLCDRRYGIGGDGLMLLNDRNGYDFEMKYYNADGNESSMCGNGGRCLVKFAYHMGIHRSTYKFMAVDGEHEAEIDTDETVSLRMKDVAGVKKFKGDNLLNTGSPHYVSFRSEIDKINVVSEAHKIRYNDIFAKEGINVNFVETNTGKVKMRTYERGVEDETLSCGTAACERPLSSAGQSRAYPA